MRFFLSLISLFLFFNVVSAQCPPGNIGNFYSSQQFEQFMTDYPNCTHVTGDLIYEPGYGVNANGFFSKITQIDGALKLGTPSVFPTFDQLDTVGSLSIWGSFGSPGYGSTASNLNGLHISHIKHNLNIHNMRNLNDCSNLCDLLTTGVDGVISFSGNKGTCFDTDMFKGVCGVIDCPEGDVSIVSEDQVLAFKQSFPNCTTINGSIFINPPPGFSYYPPGATQLDSFDNITTIMGGVDFVVGPPIDPYWTGNGAGLSNVEFIGGNVDIPNGNWIGGAKYVGGRLKIPGGTVHVDSVGGDLLLWGYAPDLIVVGGNAIVYNSLPKLEEVRGNLALSANVAAPKLTNLHGDLSLGVGASVDLLTQVNGKFIVSNDISVPLLSTVKGDMELRGLATFPSLVSVEGNLLGGDVVENWHGLDSLEQLGGDFIIDDGIFTDFTGLGKLQTVAGKFEITNSAIEQFVGLNALAHVKNMTIQANSNLANLDGLENLESIDENLVIFSNFNLSDCSGICNLLESDGVDGNITISSNPSPCSSEMEVLSTCASDSLIIDSQDDADNFVTNNPGSTVEGDLIIGSLGTYVSGLENLNGLSQLKTVTGNLVIGYIADLTSLGGLENLEHVGKDLIIFNNLELASLESLQALAFVGGSVRVENNSKLANLDGLSNMTKVGNYWTSGNSDPEDILGPSDDLIVKNNPVLTNLDGLSNVKTVGRTLDVSGNPNLVDCKGLCTLLNNGDVGGSILIFNNPSPCSNDAEVSSACVVGTDELTNTSDILIYPNPIHDSFVISGKKRIENIRIYDNLGQLMWETNSSPSTVNVAFLPKGFYLLVAQMDGEFYHKKIILK